MRSLIALLLTATTAQAWSFTPLPICTLGNAPDAIVQVRVTFDPQTALYALHMTRDAGWDAAEVFSLAFNGARPLQISTTQHSVTNGGTTLSVVDRGFGNVLDGVQFNDTATALLGDMAVQVSLQGAAPEVAKFRDCGAIVTG